MILGMIGTTELIVIGGAILLLFGGKKIPGLMKSMGQGVKSFKQGLREDLPDEDDEDKADSDSSGNSGETGVSETASESEPVKRDGEAAAAKCDEHEQKD